MESNQSIQEPVPIQFPIIPHFTSKKKFLNMETEDKNYCEEQLKKLVTNLLEIKIDKKKAKDVYLFGVNSSQEYPSIPRENQVPNKYILKAKKDRNFRKSLETYLQWHHFSGAVLYGKIKPDVNDFKVIVYFNKQKETKIITEDEMKSIIKKLEEEDRNKEEKKEEEKKEDEKKDKIYKFVFSKKIDLYNYSQDSFSGKDATMDQVLKNYYNIIIGRCLEKAKYIKDDNNSKKCYYYKNEDIENAEKIVDFGDYSFDLYKFSAIKAVSDLYEKQKIYLKINPKYLIMNKSTYFDYFQYLNDGHLNEREVENLFIRKVTNCRGLRLTDKKTEKIEEVIFEDPWNIKFTDKNGKNISVGEYLVTKYKDNNMVRSLEQRRQPIAIRYMDRGGKIPKQDAPKSYIPMCLFQVIGNIYETQINVRSLVDTPQQKMGKILDVRREISNSIKNDVDSSVSQEIEGRRKERMENIIKSSINPVEINAPILLSPKIKFGELKNPQTGEIENIYKVPKNGDFECINTAPLEVETELDDIIIFYSVYIEEAETMLANMKEAGKTMNIKNFGTKAKFVDIYDKIPKIGSILKDTLAEHKTAKFLFFFINQSDSKNYKIIKNEINKNTKIKMCSQVIKYNKKKSPMSLYTNVFCQVYAKIGEELYGVDFSFAKNTMIIAYAVTVLEGGKILTSLCINYTKSKALYAFFSDISSNDQVMPVSSKIRNMVSKAILAVLPGFRHEVKNILVYREGVNAKQINMVNSTEKDQFLNGIRDALEELQKTPDEDLQKKRKHFVSPKTCFIVVNKIDDIKAYSFNEDRTQFNNCPIGTLIDNTLVSNDFYDFHLCSTFSKQGSSGLTHYTVIHDETENNLSAADIYRITYYLCYICFNTTKSIKIPAPLYFVTRRNKFTRDNLDDIINKHIKTYNPSL